MKRIIYSLLTICLLFCGSCSSGDQFTGLRYTASEALEGRLSISADELRAHHGFVLRGDWEFYGGELLAPEMFKKGIKESKKEYIPVPDVWNRRRGDARTYPVEGYGTYRLILETDYQGVLTFSLGHPGSSFRIWINGVLKGGAGRVATRKEDSLPSLKSELFDFKPLRGANEVVIEVSNYHYGKAGLYDQIHIGEKGWMHHGHQVRLAFEFFLFGVFLIIGVFNFFVFIVRKKERAAFAFGLFSLLIGIRVMVTNKMMAALLFPHLSWEAIKTVEFLTVALGAPLFIHFLWRLFRKEVNAAAPLIAWIVAAAYSLLILFTPALIYFQFLSFYQFFYLIGGVYTVYIFILAALRRREGALINLAGFGILFLAVINDILIEKHIYSGIMVLQLGFVFFVMAQSIMLTLRFSRAFGKAEELSETLDRRVKERTRELEQERNRFKVRNEVMERELTLARQIQEQLIPHPYPNSFIASMYKPMEQVGGDFYDFLKFRDSNKIGIFLSDVSGHGVPAAFITSMVKTLILQSGPRREDPAELLSFLNSLLINQTGGNFITAFYGILDPDERTLLFSNAGHHAPIAITADSIYPVNGSRSIPLAVMDNEVLEKAGKAFSNSQVVLEEKSKLILYTDGLTETTAKNNQSVYFEDDVLNDVFREIRGQESRAFVEELISRLIMFHGSSSFDDDICLVCVDVGREA